MKKLGILTAMSVEHKQIEEMLSDRKQTVVSGLTYVEGTLGNLEIVLLQCGIGKVNAAYGTTMMLEHFQPEAVLSTGVAGGVDACLGVMDVVVSSQTVYHDMWCGPGNEWGQVQGMPVRFECDSRMLSVAVNTATDVKIVPGLICTGDLFVSKPEEQQRIKTAFPEALAVDMESAAIAQVCYLRNVPFLSFRIISDTPGAKDNISQYQDFWQTMADKSFACTRAFLYNL